LNAVNTRGAHEVEAVGLSIASVNAQSDIEAVSATPTDLEIALAGCLMRDDAVNVWRDNLDAETFDAFARARERFRGISAALALARLGAGLRPPSADAGAADGKTGAIPAPGATSGSMGLPEALAPHALALWENALVPSPCGPAWVKFPQLIFGFRFRGFPTLSKAHDKFSRSKPEAKERQKEADKNYRTRPGIARKRADAVRHWREHNHAKLLVQPWHIRRLEACDVYYHRLSSPSTAKAKSSPATT
jgi:hypothetical protein